MSPNDASQPEPMPDAPAAPPRPASYDARALTLGGNTAEIRLDGRVYTLRITHAEKLILTK